MIIDTTDDCSQQIVHLKADNVTTCIRYLTGYASDKRIQPAEAQALGAAGIRLGLVFEDGGGSPGYNDINAATGVQNAAVCLALVPLLGAPNDGSVCAYFAIDNDMTATQINTLVRPYFTSIKQAFGAHYVKYKIGVYGSGAVCAALKAAGLIDYAWLAEATAWTGSKAYLTARPPELVLVQTGETELANMDIDTNISLAPFGDFLPFAAVIPPVVVVPPVTPPPPPLTWWQEILAFLSRLIHGA